MVKLHLKACFILENHPNFAARNDQEMTIQTHIFTLLCTLAVSCVYAQHHRTEPKCPKGDPAAQMQALVPYNEAVDLYIDGERQGAKRKLKKSVNTSFALVEAHLFLADIFYEEGIRDSALYFYKSGLDFVIEQEPHYYFRLFELGMEFEQYDLVKQFLKYFKKVHGIKNHGELYETGYPYTVETYNHYADNIALVYNYKSWISPWKLEKVTPAKQLYAENAMVENGRLMLPKLKSNGRVKWKQQAKLSADPVNFQYVASHHLVLMTVQVDSSLQIYAAKLKGKKVVELSKLPSEVNEGNATADPYYDAENELLYFARKTGRGDWDLMVAKWNCSTNQVNEVQPLERINTAKDERSPYFHDNRFYFSSNGNAGFGGMDVYFTPDFERMNGYIFPMNHYNMKANINSGADEMAVHFNANGNALILQSCRYPENRQYLWFTPVELKEQLNYEITLQK